VASRFWRDSFEQALPGSDLLILRGPGRAPADLGLVAFTGNEPGRCSLPGRRFGHELRQRACGTNKNLRPSSQLRRSGTFVYFRNLAGRLDLNSPSEHKSFVVFDGPIKL
jgi:hypothetical protein